MLQATLNLYTVQLDYFQVIESIYVCDPLFSCVAWPGVLGPNTPSEVVDKVCAKFSFMGKFVARSLMDSRMVSVTMLNNAM